MSLAQNATEETLKPPSGEDHRQFDVPEAFADFTPLLARWFEQCATSSPHSEIEGKIGRFVDGKFESSVDRDWFFNKLQLCMAAGSRWLRREEETTTSYLFDNGVRGIKHKDETAVFVCKKRQSQIDLEFDGASHAVRLTHSLEVPTEPPCASTVWVRLRRRHSFFHSRFRFDFSFIHEGATYQTAKKTPLKYEIEIEYVSSEPSLAKTTTMPSSAPKSIAASFASEEKRKDGPCQQANKCADNGGNGGNKSFNYVEIALSWLLKLHDMITPNGTDPYRNARPLRVRGMK